MNEAKQQRQNKALHPTAYSSVHFVRASLHSFRFRQQVSLSLCRRAQRFGNCGMLNIRNGGMDMRYRVLIEQDEDGVFVAEVPALPGCISEGHSRTEVVENVKEAIAAYIESLEAHGEPIPPAITEELVEVMA